MDLGRKQSQVAWLTEDGEVRERRIETSRAGLDKEFGGQPRARILVEASGGSEWVARHLESLGHEVIVADPNFAPMYAERTRRIKTDRRDAMALMMACHKGIYRKAHRLSDDARLLRARVQVRKTLVRARAKSVSQTRGLLAPLGVSVPSGTPKTFPERLAGVEVPRRTREALQPLMMQVDSLSDEISELDKHLVRSSKSDASLRILTSVPGFGPVTAATWLATMDNAARFGSSNQVASFLGLVPREWSSSEQQRRGSVTKAGPCELRSLLVEAAWTVMTHDLEEGRELRAWALQVAKRRGRYKAVVALARRLGRIAFACWRDGVPMDPSRTARSPGRCASQAEA
jgi:transposase